MNDSKKNTIIAELDKLPEKFLDEILDYINLIKEKTSKPVLEIAIISESALRKDWLQPEEDEAWHDL